MIYLSELLDVAGVRAESDALPERFPGFAFDSRRVREGDLFVAMRTDRGDGHEFIADALAAGAAAVLCERWDGDEGLAILSADPLETVRRYAELAISRFGPRVVAIAGSVGKTSTREFAAHILGGQLDVFRNPDNFNDLVGLPLAIGELDPGHEVAVLEMATDSHGEMAALAKLAPPSICVLTQFDETYLDYFGSMDALAEEHRAIVDALPADGLLIYPADDPVAERLAASFDGRKISYGFESDAAVRASGLEIEIDVTKFTLKMGEDSKPVRIGMPGLHNVRNALAAAALGLSLDMDIGEIAGRMATLEPVEGRFRLLESEAHGALFDDTFSNGPASLDAALRHFDGTGLQPVGILGGIRHLGEAGPEVTDRLGPLLQAGLSALITYGDAGKPLGDAALAAGLPPDRLKEAHTIFQAAELVADLADADTPVFVKGAAEDRLERLTEKLLGAKAQANKLLCRQSPAWGQIVTVNPDAPVWIQIDLDAIGANTRRVLEIVGPEVSLLAVLKAEGYGHGALKVAVAAVRAGAGGVAVARLDEARSLREAGFSESILVLGATAPAESRQAVLSDCTLTVFDRRGIEALVRASAAIRRDVPVHLKIETGMGRLGADVAEAASLASQIDETEWLRLDGTFTHLGRADLEDKADALAQLDRFDEALVAIRKAGVSPGLVHAANSAAALTIPRARYDAVRCGITLLGLDPAVTEVLPDGFTPALTMKARIAQVKDLPAGSHVGYGTAGLLEKDTRVAVVAAGYGDGLRRGPNNLGPVLVRGRPADIIGDVCMDMFMIDVSAIPAVQAGDEVTLIGGGMHSPVSVDRVAQQTGTIGYEVITQLLPRVPRVPRV
jgi:alanine racemase